MNNVTSENSTHRLYSNMATRLLSAEEVADGYDTFPSGSSGGEVGLPSLNGHLNYNASKFITYYVVILYRKLYFFTKLQMVDDHR